MANHTNRNQGPKGPDLVSSVMQTIMSVPGHTTRSASSAIVESINADLETDYSTNDLGKWRRADRTIPQPVQDWMLRVCISHAIESCGGKAPNDDAELDRLAAMLCPPQRRAAPQHEK